jgi:hypothetical protein
MVFITHVRLSSEGQRHEHIIEVKWRNPDDGKTGSNTVAEMVDWIENKKGKAKVTDGRNTVDVGVVDAKPKYLRTYADGVWTDNLLSLPRY